MIDTGAWSSRWRALPVTVRDLPVAVGVFVLCLPALGNAGTQFGDLPTRPFDGWALVAVVLECLPLATRRRWPAASILVAATGFGLDQGLAYHTVGGTAFALGLVSAGAYVERWRAGVMTALSVSFVALAVLLNHRGVTDGPVEWVVTYVVLAAAWVMGSWLRSARALEAERRQHLARAVREAERTRIARELHDVVTHHVTAMVYQAEAARYLAADPARLDETLGAVTGTGRQAITDLRHLLDLLNPEHHSSGREPTIGALDVLVGQTRDAGQPVDLVIDGVEASSTGSGEFVTYRVVQEALTNALKYAHGCPTVVRVSYGEKRIAVDVRTTGTGSEAASGSGRGLNGLRDRVEMLGGTFESGPSDQGFVVRAVIPA
ncbi:sensor histidine kinase [Kineosporia succinea]|uniref:histidine kinase n=1 Tax=Kineosporia succinea TaxID=84632 RepID=A0ABT9P7V0_9ACTN|nr:histidine kinase [Kineosporia succinea]MDP9828769.1 signal transduction histidine kinase [Kineosporia succinea]